MNFDETVSRLSAADQKMIKEMMSLFEDTSHQAEKFSLQTGLKCKHGCGACCSAPDIETTSAEVLPLAAYLWSQGIASNILKDLQSNPNDTNCIFYRANPNNREQGSCEIYAFRPGLCRLFGFAARRDKHGKMMLMTCKVIKESQPESCQRTQEALENGLQAPLLTAHASAVSNIDPVHGQKLLPINQAIKEAIEKIGYCIDKN